MIHSKYSLLILGCLIQLNIIATSFTPSSKAPEFPDYNPFSKEGIFALNDEDSYNLVYRCKIKPSEELDYWILSESLIRLVDKRLKDYLKKNKLSSTKKVHKQYFGMITEANHKFIYIFIYPPPSSAIGKEEGNSILLCGNISDAYLKIEFDYKTLKFLKL